MCACEGRVGGVLFVVCTALLLHWVVCVCLPPGHGVFNTCEWNACCLCYALPLLLLQMVAAGACTGFCSVARPGPCWLTLYPLQVSVCVFLSEGGSREETAEKGGGRDGERGRGGRQGRGAGQHRHVPS